MYCKERRKLGIFDSPSRFHSMKPFCLDNASSTSTKILTAFNKLKIMSIDTIPQGRNYKLTRGTFYIKNTPVFLPWHTC